jgi:uridine kinase
VAPARGFTRALADRVEALRRERGDVMTGIDGRGGMGKSTIVMKLAAALGPVATVLELDDFFLPLSQHPPFVVHEIGHLRLDELKATLSTLRGGGAASYRPYDWERAELASPRRVRAGCVIVEGLYALRREIDPGYDLRLWVEGELSQRMERVYARSGDGATREEARADPFARLWRDEFVPREQAYIEAERPWDRADLVVAGAGLAISDVGAQFLTPAPSELSPEPPRSPPSPEPRPAP